MSEQQDKQETEGLASGPMQWWQAQSPNNKRNLVVALLAIAAVLMLVMASGGLKLPSGGRVASDSASPKPIDPYVFGGGRSNIRAIEDLDRSIRRISERIDRMATEQDEAIERLETTRTRFEDWVKSTDIERQALQAKQRLRGIDSKVKELEEKVEAAELRGEGIAQLSLDSDATPLPDSSGSQERAGDEGTERPQRPEPPSPRPEPQRDGAPQDIFSGTGMTPQGALVDAPGTAPETIAPPPQRVGLQINGQSLEEIVAERQRAQASAAEQSQSPADGSGAQAAAAPAKAGDHIDENLPVGSIVSAVLLHGMDAPTGTGSRGQPVPTIARIKDLSILPNMQSMDLEDCHVLIAAYGELSSERAMGRTEDLSCTTREGEIVHARIQGYVVGPDGKVGVRGPIIQRNGKLIVRSIQSGVLSGLGQMFGGRRRGLTISTTGRLAEQDLGEAAEEGFGRGVGRAMENISKYYLRLAESVFPVVSIEAGTPIDIVITGQAKLTP